MVKYLALFVVVLLNVLFAQSQDGSGSVAPKPGSSLPSEPKPLASRSTTANCGCSRVITFDDITTVGKAQFSTISNGYNGLSWSNAYYLNTTWEAVTYGWNGYATGRNSGVFVAFNGGGQLMTISVPVGQYFQLNSAVLASAWNDNLMLSIKGIRANVVVYQTIVTLQVTSKTTLYAFKWSGIDTVSFNSTGGTPHPNLSGVGTQFVLDDLDMSI